MNEEEMYKTFKISPTVYTPNSDHEAPIQRIFEIHFHELYLRQIIFSRFKWKFQVLTMGALTFRLSVC